MSRHQSRVHPMPPDSPAPEPRSVFIDRGDLIDQAMALAWEDTIRRHRRLGAPLYCWVDGHVQAIDPHMVPLPDDDGVQIERRASDDSTAAG